MKEALVIFAKAPLPGQVKTRLIGALTAEQVTELYVCFLRDTFAVMEAVQEEREQLSLALCYTPAEELEAFEAAEFDGCLLLSQRGHDLGERLQNCFADFFELGFGAMVVIGADSPTLPAELVHEAFEHLLTPDQVVLGPATDGGFYLVGMNGLQPHLYEQIDWSAEKTLSQMLARAEQRHLTCALLPEWYDLDTPADLQHLQQQIAAGQAAPKYTGRYLRKRSLPR